MSIFNPYVLLGVLLAAMGIYSGGYYHGWTAKDKETQVEIAAMNMLAKEAEDKMREDARAKEEDYRKAQSNAEKRIANLQSNLRDGTQRLFIKTKTPVCPVSASSDAPVASGTDDRETRTELDAETSANLVGITGEGDIAIRKLNLCIQQYNEVRDTLYKQMKGNQ